MRDYTTHQAAPHPVVPRENSSALRLPLLLNRSRRSELPFDEARNSRDRPLALRGVDSLLEPLANLLRDQVDHLIRFREPLSQGNEAMHHALDAKMFNRHTLGAHTFDQRDAIIT